MVQIPAVAAWLALTTTQATETILDVFGQPVKASSRRGGGAAVSPAPGIPSPSPVIQEEGPVACAATPLANAFELEQTVSAIGADRSPLPVRAASLTMLDADSAVAPEAAAAASAEPTHADTTMGPPTSSPDLAGRKRARIEDAGRDDPDSLGDTSDAAAVAQGSVDAAALSGAAPATDDAARNDAPRQQKPRRGFGSKAFAPGLFRGRGRGRGGRVYFVPGGARQRDGARAPADGHSSDSDSSLPADADAPVHLHRATAWRPLQLDILALETAALGCGAAPEEAGPAAAGAVAASCAVALGCTGGSLATAAPASAAAIRLLEESAGKAADPALNHGAVLSIRSDGTVAQDPVLQVVKRADVIGTHAARRLWDHARWEKKCGTGEAVVVAVPVAANESEAASSASPSVSGVVSAPAVVSVTASTADASVPTPADAPVATIAADALFAASGIISVDSDCPPAHPAQDLLSAVMARASTPLAASLRDAFTSPRRSVLPWAKGWSRSDARSLALADAVAAVRGGLRGSGGDGGGEVEGDAAGPVASVAAVAPDSEPPTVAADSEPSTVAVAQEDHPMMGVGEASVADAPAPPLQLDAVLVLGPPLGDAGEAGAAPASKLGAAESAPAVASAAAACYSDNAAREGASSDHATDDAPPVAVPAAATSTAAPSAPQAAATSADATEEPAPQPPDEAAGPTSALAAPQRAQPPATLRRRAGAIRDALSQQQRRSGAARIAAALLLDLRDALFASLPPAASGLWEALVPQAVDGSFFVPPPALAELAVATAVAAREAAAARDVWRAQAYAPAGKPATAAAALLLSSLPPPTTPGPALIGGVGSLATPRVLQFGRFAGCEEWFLAWRAREASREAVTAERADGGKSALGAAAGPAEGGRLPAAPPSSSQQQQQQRLPPGQRASAVLPRLLPPATAAGPARAKPRRGVSAAVAAAVAARGASRAALTPLPPVAAAWYAESYADVVAAQGGPGAPGSRLQAKLLAVASRKLPVVQALIRAGVFEAAVAGLEAEVR